jgi:hypothetical protein
MPRVVYRNAIACFIAASLLFAGVAALAQSSDLADIQKQLLNLYTPAKATADGTDLVTAGAVLILQKDNLQMCKVDQPVPTANFYKNGTITQGGLGGLLKAMNTLSRLGNQGGSAGAAQDMREFVAGEKFFVTRIATVPDGVVFTLMSDPIKDQRYKSTLKFPFPRGSVPTADGVTAMVAEVVKVDAGSDAPADQGTSASNAPVPAPAPKTIAIGQTRDQVVAAFGVPTKVVQLGAKEIDFFADMKVTFLNNKVANVE